MALSKLKNAFSKKLTPEQQKKEDEEYAKFLVNDKLYEERTQWELASSDLFNRAGRRVPAGKDTVKYLDLLKKIEAHRKKYPNVPNLEKMESLRKKFSKRKQKGGRRRMTRRRTSRKSYKKNKKRNSGKKISRKSSKKIISRKYSRKNKKSKRHSRR